ncbi:MAG: RNA polymerase subunit sigma-70 [Armatimonadetes bacterium JP3_11]|jgi:RNA polymerase sigma-70 factor (ECF subfamily)|nr:MAG: RNA polymerase subunit sigma-70 [Armatimonadetes bacterium CP1_7O]OYT75359.1 MAG: RNA polymerase subunit sigma-70 [Armatimonadetes bacterium JP3_11]RMH06203.1 MAG: sigma-70 family RNA polymerase sigma factor [Armatimonadota bacterium]
METAMTHTAVAYRMEDRLQREFDELVYRHYQQAYNTAYRLTGNAADAEDLVQEAFVRAYRFFDRYDRSMPFMNWFNRILTNLYIDEYRRRGRLRTVSIDETFNAEDGEEGATLDLPDTQPNPLELALNNEYLEAIHEGLQHLPSEFRAAVVLADLEGYSYEEIAEIMGTSIGTVRSRIHRGRKQLRDYIKKRHPNLFERGDLK